MLRLNSLEGLVCLLIGLALLVGARQIASLSTAIRDHRQRNRAPGTPSPANDVAVGTKSRRIAVIFWRMCGLLWVFGGASLLFNPDLAVRFPWQH